MDPGNDIREFLISPPRGKGPSLALDGIAHALQLDEGDRMHLFDLVRAVNTTPGRRSGRRPTQERVRPVILRILDSLVGVPAFVQNTRGDVLAWNQLGEAFYAPQFGDPVFYSAEGGSPSRDRLDLLASWATTPTEPRRN